MLIFREATFRLPSRMKRSSLFLYLFAIVSIGELLALSRGWPEVHVVCKSTIMLALIGYYMGEAMKRNTHIIRAMFFCWTGDVMLLKQADAEIYFILGLFAFLVGHVLYILAYRQLQWSDVTNALLPTQKFRAAFPVVLAGTGLLVVLIPRLGGLTIPVIIYSLVLIVMVISAVFRSGRTTPASYWLLTGGALSFMISDSILAINKFHTPLEFASPVIMLTYIIAQYLIVEGVLKHPSETH